MLDFGLARLLDDTPAAGEPVTAITRMGQVVGSMPWFSPEQAAGTPAEVDARTDVYAIGVMLYDAVTGRRRERELLNIERFARASFRASRKMPHRNHVRMD